MNDTKTKSLNHSGIYYCSLRANGIQGSEKTISNTVCHIHETKI